MYTCSFEKATGLERAAEIQLSSFVKACIYHVGLDERVTFPSLCCGFDFNTSKLISN